MKVVNQIFSASCAALAVLWAPTALAAVGSVYQSSFQGVTFTFTQTDADTLTFNLKGTLGGDWSTAHYLGAFDLKDLGLDFGSTTATANGPGASNLAGLNDQLSGSNVLCTAPGSPTGGVCFNISPDQFLAAPFNLTYTIDFSKPLAISANGPHLQLAMLAAAGDTKKVGSLYSQNVGLASSGGGGASSSGGGGASSSGTIPEPSSNALAFLGLAALGSIAWKRRKA